MHSPILSNGMAGEDNNQSLDRGDIGARGSWVPTLAKGGIFA